MVMSSVTQHDVFAALDRTYGLLDGSTGWSECLETLIDLADIAGCSLYLYDCSRGHSELLASKGQLRRDARPTTQAVIDDFLWRAAPGTVWSPLGKGRQDGGFDKSAMASQAADVDAEAFAVIDRDQAHVLYLAFNNRQAGHPLDRDSSSMLDAIVPHLHRACRLHCSMRGQSLQQFTHPDRSLSGETANMPIEMRLRRRFKLSKAEARVAKLLAEGLAPRIIADRLHVSIHTVRSQLQSIFQKTDTCRQAELTSRLLREIEIPTAICQSPSVSMDNRDHGREHRSCL